MREIKFRGKTATVDGQNWVYGHYTRVESFFNDKKKDYIEVIKSNHMQDYAVVENTVGQYTGLKDKNGVEIYEGDIVQARYFEDSTSEKYVVKYDTDRAGFFPFACGDGCGCCETNVISATYAEILGNIYDNPELIEKGR